MAAVKSTDQVDVVGQGLDEDVVDIVVANHTRFAVVDGHKSLVITVFFFAVIVVADLGSASHVMAKDGVAGLAVGNELFVGRQNIVVDCATSPRGPKRVSSACWTRR
jgi:hypothetical protein